MYLVEKITHHRTTSQSLFNDLFKSEIFNDIIKSQCGEFENVRLVDLPLQDTEDKIKVDPIEVVDSSFTEDTLSISFFITDDYQINVSYDFNFKVIDLDGQEYENETTFDFIEYEINNETKSFELNHKTKLVLNTFVSEWMRENDIDNEVFLLVKNDYLNA